jgi:hypothetical protein
MHNIVSPQNVVIDYVLYVCVYVCMCVCVYVDEYWKPWTWWSNHYTKHDI